MKYVIPITLCMFLCSYNFAQDDSLQLKKMLQTRFDSLKPIKAHQFRFHFDVLSSIYNSVALDTHSTAGFHNRGKQNHQINLGNVGLSNYDLVFSKHNFIFNDYTRLAYQPKITFPIIHSEKPLTYAEYQTGSAQEQFFKVFHTQTHKNSNFIIGLDKVNSRGFYQNQASNNTHFYSRIVGTSKKNNYNYLLNFDRSKIVNQLNGGIFNDSDFTNNQLAFSDKGLLSVNLLQANQTLLQQEALFLQSFLISNRNKNENLHASKTYLTNEIAFFQQKRHFYDTILSTTFYDYYNYSTDVSRDTLLYRQARTSIGIKHNSHAKRPLLIMHSKVAISLNNVQQKTLDSTVLDVEWVNKIHYEYRKLIVDASFNYLINDAYSNNDINSELNMCYNLSDKWNVKGITSYYRNRPQIDILSYQANNISWSNTFTKTAIFNSQIALDYNDSKSSFQLFSSYTDIKNPIFFNLFRQPQQIDGISQVIQTGINSKLKLKKWQFENQTVYQYVGGFQVIKIPQFHTHLLAEYTFGVFKNKMNMTLGTTIQYFSKYEAPMYDPVSNQFYIASSYKVGNYPFVDVFLKARIQRVKIMLMSSHANQGLLGNTYFNLPHYPSNDRMFKIALSWLFIN